MPVTFKNRGTFGEILTGIFYFNFFFPMNVFWIVMAGVLIRVTHVTDFLRSGQYLWFAGAVGHLYLFQLFFVSLALIGLYGLVYLVRYAKAGTRDEEFTFDEGSVSIKTEANELKLALAKIPGYVETRKHFVMVRPDMGVTVFGKKLLSQEQVKEIRVILRAKHRKLIEWAGKLFWPFSFLVLAVTVYALVTPRYSARSTSDNPQAFWQEDTAVISIPVYIHGQKEVLFQVMHPMLYVLWSRGKQPDIAKPVIENYVIVVKDGKMKSVTLRSDAETMGGAIQPVGNDLYLMRYVKRRQEFSKFDGNDFVALSEEARTELLKRMKECRRDRCGWRQFRLWDEAEEEKENEEADQEYRATIPLKSSTLVLGMNVTWVDRQQYARDCIYTLKGLEPKGGVQELLSVGGKQRQIGGEEYDKLFPDKMSIGGMPATGMPGGPATGQPSPVLTPSAPAVAGPPAEAIGNTGTAAAPAEPKGNSAAAIKPVEPGTAEKPVEPTGTSGTAAASIDAGGTRNTAAAPVEAAGNTKAPEAVPTTVPAVKEPAATPAAAVTEVKP
jgi:hypothetical protein